MPAAFDAQPDRSLTRQFWAKYGLTFLVIAVPFLALIAYQTYTSLLTAKGSARTNAQNLALVLESKLNTEFENAERVVSTLVAEIPLDAMYPAMASRYRGDMTRRLKSRVETISMGSPLRYFDANGNRLYSSVDSDPLVSIANRPFFQQLKDTPGSATVFSEVTLGRISKHMLISVAKGIRGTDGTFLGAALTSVDMNKLHEHFRGIELGKEGVIAVRRLEHGGLVVRFPGPVEVDGKPWPDIPIRLAILKNGPTGVSEIDSPVDGARRIFGYRTIGRFPFFVLVGIADNDYLAEWRRNSVRSLLASLLFLAILSTGFVQLARAESRRQRSELKLRESEERYGIIFTDAKAVILLIDPETGGIIETNPAAEQFYGYDRARMLQMKISDINIAPEQVRTEIQNAKQERRDFFAAHRLASGEIRRVEVHAGPFRSARKFAIYAMIYDVTEREQAEQQLRIAAIAFESQEGMVVSGADHVILRVNRAFTDITGYTAEEAVGRTTNLLKSGRHDAGFYAAMWQSLSQQGTWQGEIWNRRKNGDIYPEWLTITVVKGSLGEVTNYVATLADMSLRKAAEKEINALAFYDPLTHLPNRRLLLDRLHQALASASRSGREGALLFIDLDDFKTLNDTLGHDVGDVLLQQVAKRLTECIREHDSVARLGGDEFVVMLEGLSENTQEAASQAEAVGEKILAHLNQPYLLAGHQHHSTPSIGATLFNRHHRNSLDELLKRADLAMYQAKAAGRNTLCFFDPEMQAVVTARAMLESDLRHGLQHNEFLLYYQSQVDGEGCITGAEALLRWQHTGRGLLSPGAFISLAEETGLILPLGRWVLETACAQLATWADSPSMCHLTVAVNVSARQFHSPDFAAEVLAILHQTRADPRKLKLELTESLLLDDVEDIVAKMSILKAKGVGFALDDFGTGYSSLSYLKRLPLDQLKIDQSFVRDILIDPNDAAIARTIVALADSMGLAVIAEGVETEEQRDCLARLNCHAFQGYLFSRPLPAEKFVRAVIHESAPTHAGADEASVNP